MKVFVGSDHTGYEFKEKLKVYLSGLGYEVEDKGAFSYEPYDDYPDFVTKVAEAVVTGKENFGIILGGSGQGEAMCANRKKGARAVVFYGPREAIKEVEITGRKSSDPFELIKLVRIHNNANILSIAMRFTTEEEAKFAARLFLTTQFKKEERHVRRLSKFD